MRLFRVFIGYDERVAVTYHIMAHSIQTRASKPVLVTPLILDQLPITKKGLTDFTYSRFLVPWLCNYGQQPALFVDPDMVVLDDIYKMIDEATPNVPLALRKHDRRFEWQAVMLFRPDLCRELTPEYIETHEPQKLEWASEVGTIPDYWHHVIPYDPPMENAKLVHYTAGVPSFPEIAPLGLGYESAWLDEVARATACCSWLEFMGSSVHAPIILDMIKERIQKRYDERKQSGADSSSPPT